jgi:hypothetical protein
MIKTGNGNLVPVGLDPPDSILQSLNPSELWVQTTVKIDNQVIATSAAFDLHGSCSFSRLSVRVRWGYLLLVALSTDSRAANAASVVPMAHGGVSSQ